MTATYTRALERGGVPLTRGYHLWTYDVNISSYTTGGESLTAANLGISKIRSIVGKPVSRDTTKGLGRELIWDQAGAKLFAYVTSTAAQVAGTTDIGIWLVTVIGR